MYVGHGGRVRLLIALVLWAGVSIPFALGLGRALRQKRSAGVAEEVETYLRGSESRTARYLGPAAPVAVALFVAVSVVGLGTQAMHRLPDATNLAHRFGQVTLGLPTTTTTRPGNSAIAQGPRAHHHRPAGKRQAHSPSAVTLEASATQRSGDTVSSSTDGAANDRVEQADAVKDTKPTTTTTEPGKRGRDDASDHSGQTFSPPSGWDGGFDAPPSTTTTTTPPTTTPPKANDSSDAGAGHDGDSRSDATPPTGTTTTTTEPNRDTGSTGSG